MILFILCNCCENEIGYCVGVLLFLFLCVLVEVYFRSVPFSFYCHWSTLF